MTEFHDSIPFYISADPKSEKDTSYYYELLNSGHKFGVDGWIYNEEDEKTEKWYRRVSPNRGHGFDPLYHMWAGLWLDTPQIVSRYIAAREAVKEDGDKLSRILHELRAEADKSPTSSKLSTISFWSYQDDSTWQSIDITGRAKINHRLSYSTSRCSLPPDLSLTESGDNLKLLASHMHVRDNHAGIRFACDRSRSSELRSKMYVYEEIATQIAEEKLNQTLSADVRFQEYSRVTLDKRVSFVFRSEYAYHNGPSEWKNISGPMLSSQFHELDF